jgi:hypothetical protein
MTACESLETLHHQQSLTICLFDFWMRRRLLFCAKNREQAKAKALNPQETAKALARSTVTMSEIVSDSAKRRKKDGAEKQQATGFYFHRQCAPTRAAENDPLVKDTPKWKADNGEHKTERRP